MTRPKRRKTIIVNNTEHDRIYPVWKMTIYYETYDDTMWSRLQSS